MFSNTKGILSRSEMKSIMAGGGNIMCRVGVDSWYCHVGDLESCLDACVEYGDLCGGCAQFPELE